MRLKKIPFTIVGFMTKTSWEGIVISKSSTQYWVNDDIVGFFETEHSKTFFI